MSLFVLDRKVALVVIDLQRGIVDLPLAQPIAGVVGRCAALATAFRRRGLPVVLVNVVGAAPGRAEQARSVGEWPAGWTELVPELDRQPTDHLVTKRTRGAFTRTGLESHLREQGVTQVVVVGVSTSGGVESTARQAYELGFNVALAVDAMTDREADAQAYSVSRVFPKLGETGATREILSLVEQNGSV